MTFSVSMDQFFFLKSIKILQKSQKSLDNADENCFSCQLFLVQELTSIETSKSSRYLLFTIFESKFPPNILLRLEKARLKL